jgi:hypothetical protein
LRIGEEIGTTASRMSTIRMGGRLLSMGKEREV